MTLGACCAKSMQRQIVDRDRQLTDDRRKWVEWYDKLDRMPVRKLPAHVALQTLGWAGSRGVSTSRTGWGQEQVVKLIRMSVADRLLPGDPSWQFLQSPATLH